MARLQYSPQKKDNNSPAHLYLTYLKARISSTTHGRLMVLSGQIETQFLNFFVCYIRKGTGPFRVFCSVYVDAVIV